MPDDFQQLAELAATRWRCEKCDASGVVTYDGGAGVYEVVQLLRKDHAAAIGYRPERCNFDLAAVRVEVVEWA